MARPASSSPKDADGTTLQVLRPTETDGSHQVSVISSSVRNSTAFKTATRSVQLWATQDCRYRFGTSGVTATASTDHFLPASQLVTYAIGGDSVGQSTHIAFIRETADGQVEITELE